MGAGVAACSDELVTPLILALSGAPEHDVVSCSAMISAYAEHGHGQEALNLYENMKHKYLEPTKITFLCLLKACASIGSLYYGGVIHVHIVKQGIELDVYVGSSLIRFVQDGFHDEALVFFWRMQANGIDPDDVSYVFILKSCGSAAALGQGCQPKMLCCGPLRSLLMLNMGKVN